MKTHYYTDEILQVCDNKHLTAEDIFYLLKLKYSDIGISSVYRNIERLANEWKIKKIIGMNKKSYYEKNIGDHIHFVDEDSWEIHDILEKDFVQFNLPSDFSVSSYDIKIYWKKRK